MTFLAEVDSFSWDLAFLRLALFSSSTTSFPPRSFSFHVVFPGTIHLGFPFLQRASSFFAFLDPPNLLFSPF